MIANASIALTLFQAGHSILESGMYGLIANRKDLPEFIQKISSYTIERFQELQNVFSNIDYISFIPRILLPFINLGGEIPKLFLYTCGIGNLTLLFIRVFWAEPASQSNKIENALFTRIMSIAFNAITLTYFGIYPLILASSFIGIAASLYSFYKNRQFEWIAVDRTLNPPVKEAQQLIQSHIQTISKLFENLYIPSPKQNHPAANSSGFLSLLSPLHIPISFDPVAAIDFSMFSWDNSLRSRTEREKKNLKNEENFDGSPGTLVQPYIKQKLEQLIQSTRMFGDRGIIEKRKEILFRWFERFLNPFASELAKTLVYQIIPLANIRIREIELSAKIFVEKNENHDATCPFCLEDNANLQICENGHPSHENCFHEYLKSGLDKFLPREGNVYTLEHTDNYNATQYGMQIFSNTSHKYSIKISPKNVMCCPTCRGSLLSSKFEVKKIEDIEYGIIENNHLVIEEKIV